MGVAIGGFPFLLSGKVCFFVGLTGGTSSSIEARSISKKLISFLGFSFRNVVEKNMVSGLEKYGKEGHGVISGTCDLVQRDFHCCGILSFTDWSGVANFSEG